MSAGRSAPRWLLLALIAPCACAGSAAPAITPDAGPSDEDRVQAICSAGAGSFAGLVTVDGHREITGQCEIRSQAQVAELNLSGIDTIAGSLHYTPPDDPEIDFLHVTSVAILRIGPTPAMRRVSFPVLSQTESFAVSENEALVDVNFPSLVAATTTFAVLDNPQLSACAAQQLAQQLSAPPQNPIETSGNCDNCCGR